MASSVIGTIRFVIGQVFVVASDGTQRQLVAGDRIYNGEEVVTGNAGAVSILLPDGHTLDLGRDSRWGDGTDITPQQPDPTADVAALQEAIAQGADPTQVLEATAAGAGNGDIGEAGDGGGGHSTADIMLNLTGKIVDPTAGFDTTGITNPATDIPRLTDPNLLAAQIQGTSIPSDTTSPSVVITFNRDGSLNFQFTEAPVGFDLSDITVNNGIVSDLLQDPNDPTHWTAVLTPSSNFEGSVTVSVADGSYTDQAGNVGSGGQVTTQVDTLPPEASITIDTLTADNTINAAEAGQNQTVSGTVGNDVQVGDTVTVTIGSQSYQTQVTTAGDGSRVWSVSVPGSVLAGQSAIQATVTTADAAGNPATATADHSYQVDTRAPEASITIDALTADNTINTAEAGQNQTVSGTVGNDVQVGDTVTVTIGSQSYQTQITSASDGSRVWSVSVPGSVLATNAAIQATVTTADAAGNPASASADHAYQVDTSAPEASITIDAVTADNTINAAEAGQNQTVSGTVGNDVQVGDTVTVTIGSATYQTQVTSASDGSRVWSVSVPGSVLATNAAIQATVTTADAAGNPATATADHSYQVDTSAPEASITIDAVTADNTINAAEAGQNQTVSGTVGNDVQVGDTVTVTIGSQTYQTQVTTAGDGSRVWSVSVPGSVLATNAAIQATVTTADAAGNPASASADHAYQVDTSAPEASITIDALTADNVLNQAEAGQNQTVSGTVGNDVQVGDTVTVTIGSATYQTQVTSASDGSRVWSVSVPGSVLATNAAIQATVTIADTAGNSTSASADHAYQVDTSAPEASITIDALTADNVLNQAEAGQNQTVSGTVGNDVQVGDTVTVTIGSQSYQTQVTTAGDGSRVWSVSVPGSVLAMNAAIQATVTTSDTAGNPASASADHAYQVDTSAPEASITIDALTADNVLNQAEAGQNQTVSGTVGNDVQVGDTVTVTIGSATYQTQVTSASDGSRVWSVSVPGSVLATNAAIQATVTIADTAGNSTSASADHAYQVDTSAPEASITIDALTADNVLNQAEAGQNQTVSGTVGNDVQVGDTVTVTIGSQSYQTQVTTAGDGSRVWSVSVPGSVLAMNAAIQATVTTSDTAGNPASASADHAYQVDTRAPEASITIDAVTADNTINTAEAGQNQTVSGTVGNDVQVGDTVTVTIGSQSYQTQVTSASDGSRVWSVSVPGSVLATNAAIQATVTTTDAAGNPASASADHAYQVDTSAPEASITIDALTADNTINAAEAGQNQTVSGTVGNDVQVGDTVTVTIGSQTYQTQVTTAGDGSRVWSVSVPGSVLATNAAIQATVTTSDTAGNSTTATADHSYQVDTSAPEASITIDALTADNTINAAEAGQNQTVSGTVGNDVQVGDTVTVTIGSATYQTQVTTAGDGSRVWSVSVPGSVLAGQSAIQATVTTADTAGNSTSATADHSYQVDTSAPEASITIDAVTADNTINAAEAGQNQTVSGTVGNDVQVGDTVTVTIGSQTYQTQVTSASDGSRVWSISVPGSVLAGQSAIQATVTTADAAGNPASATADHSYQVDTTAPEASITIDAVTADNTINAAEAGQNQTVSGTVGNDVQVGDTVTVTIGSQTYQTQVTSASDGSRVWSISVPGSVLAGQSAIQATVTTADAAGNPASATADHSYQVDTTAPEASITIDAVTADNTINAAEAGQNQTVSGTVGNDVQVGDTVTVTIGSATYQTQVTSASDGSRVWSISVPGSVLATNAAIQATVTTADAAGNPATASADHAYQVDTSAPEASITIDTLTADNVLNQAEAGQNQTVSGTVGNDVQVGDTVTVTIGSQSYQAQVTSAGDGSRVWSVSVPGSVLAGQSAIQATVTTADTAGNSTTATADHSYQVDTRAPEASITIDAVTADNMINAVEAGQNQTVSGTVGNDVQVGDTVTVTIGSQSYQTQVTTAGDGSRVWSVSVPGSVLATNAAIQATVTTADAAGNSTSASADHAYQVDTRAPEASITIDAVTADNTINAAEAGQNQTVSGTVGNDVQVGDTVTVTIGSQTYQTEVTSASDGSRVWSVSVPGSVLATNAAIQATVTTADTAGNSTTATADHSYQVDTSAPEASITIDAVTADNTINAAEAGQNQTVSGTVGNDVQVGDTVTVTIGSQTYQTQVTSASDGSRVWSVSVPGSVLATNAAIQATVTTSDTAGNSTSASADHAYQVDTSAPEASITIDALTADNVLNQVEAGQNQTVSGTVGNDVQVGDTVTVTIGSQSYQTQVTSASDGSRVWSVSVPGSVLATNAAIQATVTTADAAGNPASASADHAYQVDTSAPEASITIDALTADNVLNQAEAGQNQTVSGTVGNDVQVGDTVTVTIGSATYQTQVTSASDGSRVWSVSVPGSVLATNAAIQATVTIADTAGNSTSASADHAYQVDTSAPEASITIDALTADNVLNQAEAGQNQTVSGTVGNDVQVGDTVTVTIGSQSYQTQVTTAGDGSRVWSVSVPGSVLAMNAAIQATVTTSDTAGNPASASADHAYQVDTRAPEASITIDAVTADNTINTAEAGQNQTVSGTVGNDVQVGDTVTVTIGSQSYQTQVTSASDGSRVWSVSVPGSVLATNAAIQATVTTTDAAGNPASASADHAYQVDTSAPEASITIDALTADNVLNQAEAGQNQTVSGTVGNDVQVGDTVTVTIGSQSYQTQVTTAGDGSRVWSVSVPGSVLAGQSAIQATVTTADTAGNSTSATADHSYQVDTSAPEASITIDALTADNTINAAEAGQNQTVSGTVGNDVQVGDTVTVTIGSATYQTQVTTASDGSRVWSVSVPGSVLATNAAIQATVTTTDAAGNPASATADHSYQVDTSAPEASITIDALTADNTINAAEAGQNQTVSGTVGNDVQVGDTVTVTIGSATYQTQVTSASDGSRVWSISVPGSVLATNAAIQATVTTTDTAGNSTSASADHAYQVDTSAPEASITIDAVTADNTINTAEAGQNQTVSGTVGNDVQVGDTVTVTIGSATYQTQVTSAGDGSRVWSVSVPGSVLATNAAIQATVTTADAAGNPATATADHSYQVDTRAPEASITIDAVTADNTINAVEAGQNQTVSGTVGNDVQVGDTVTVTIGSATYQTQVTSAGDGSRVWSVSVPGSVLETNAAIQATVTTADTAGNSTSATADHSYQVDTSAPEASITIDAVTADNVLNQAEAGQNQTVSGTVGNDVQVGDTVTVTIGSQSYQTQVTTAGDGSRVWSVSVPGSVLAGQNAIQATVTTADAAGNPASATADHSYQVDTTAPEASITIDALTADNVLNQVEAGQNQTVSGTVGNDVQVGDTVTVTIGSQTYQTQVTTASDGSRVWSVSVPGSVLAGQSAIQATVTTADTAGNSTTATADHSYQVDTSAPEASITIDALTADNTINAAEAGQNQTVSGTVGNDVQVGDTVTVTIGSATYQTQVTSASDGSRVWSVSVPGSVLATNAAIQATVTTADAAGNLASATADHSYQVDTSAPEASISIDAVTADNTINAAEAGQNQTVSGTVGNDVQVGDTVTVTIGSATYQTQVTSAGDGSRVWSVSVPGSVLATNAAIQATVTTSDTAGNPASATADHAYQVDTRAPEASITIDAVTADNTINAAEAGQNQTVSGTVGNDVQVGDTVTVTIGSATYQTQVTSASDGSRVWSVSVPGSVLATNAAIQATVTTADAAGNPATATADHSYQVDTSAPEASITIDAVTADNTINAVEAGQNQTVSGTVGNDVQVGDTVTVTIGSATYQTQVTTASDGSRVWSVSVPGSVLATNAAIQATVTTADAAGNPATATADHSYQVDTSAPEASITIDAVTADNTINTAEAGQNQTVSGTVGNDVQVGDTVTVTIGSATYQTQVTSAGDGSRVWSVSVPGSVLATNAAIQATVTTSDTAGNSTSASADHAYQVDTSAPEASITIDPVTADNTLNEAESGQTQIISGSVGKDVQAGDTVIVTVGDRTYATIVNADGISWSVSILGSVLAMHSQISAAVTIQDEAGNTMTATADRSYMVDTTEPDVAITEFAGNDGYISQGELANTAVGGTSSESAVDLVFTDANGKSVTVNNVQVVEGQWSLHADLSTLAEGQVTVMATATSPSGNHASDTDSATLDITGPVGHDQIVTGTEDTPVSISWSDLGTSGDTSSIVISSLPDASTGTLYFNDHGQWKAVSIGQTFTSADFELRFVPAANISGADLTGMAYQPVDDAGNHGDTATLSVNITPVADAPDVSLTITNGDTVGETPTYIKVNGGSEQPGGFDVQDGVIVRIGDGVRVWLSPGDPVPEIVGNGEVVYYNQGNVSGSRDYTDIFVVHEGSGYVQDGNYRTLNAVTGNTGSESSGVKSDYIFIQGTQADGYNDTVGTNNNADTSVNTFDSVNVTYHDVVLIGGANKLDGIIYGDGTIKSADASSTSEETVTGQAGYQEHAITVSAALTDTDGSESLSGITLTGIPEGTVLIDHINNVTVTIGADGAYLIPNSLHADSLAGQITLQVPVDAGQFDVVAQATATEQANYDSATGYSSQSVEQYAVTVGTSGSDTITGTHSNDIVVGDVSGLQIVEGQNYNIAFLVDSSGSMSTENVAKAITSLTDVFNSLIHSASGSSAGTVNVFLADFDSQVGQTVSVNLADPNALSSLTAVLGSMVSGGGTNYEDVFKTAANWFLSDTVTHNQGTNLTYFITDGEPTFYQSGETDSAVVSNSWWQTQTLNIDNIDYQQGQSYSMNIMGAAREVIDTNGDVYSYSQGWGNQVYRSVIGHVNAEGDGTYEISYLDGTGNSTTHSTITNSQDAFALLQNVSTVEAIGIGDSLNAASLVNYDSDGVVQDHIDPTQLNDAILGSNQPAMAGDDTLSGGSGNDILFGDSITFDGIEGNGLTALQHYIAGKLNTSTGESLTVQEMHNYISGHSAEFDLSSSHDGNDILNGGVGNDILFGQGGKDVLNGGMGNDILYGGSGDDILIGGSGNNILTGGAGADTFTWQSGDTGHDVIKDFNPGEGDRIDLSDLVGELKSGTDISHYIRITESDGSPTIEVSTQGQFNGASGGTPDVSITLDHYHGVLPSVESLISKPEPSAA
ncbi:Ig-like domain-containing protein [Pectobacteriaceae bacterium C111]|nr:Ig-like domain-containing protein [Pectobacteriaceae bacterium C111]